MVASHSQHAPLLLQLVFSLPVRPSLPPALILSPLYPPNLLLKILSLEGEQEPAHMVLTQLVDATGINGTAQELIHLIFRVQSILGATADNRIQVSPCA